MLKSEITSLSKSYCSWICENIEISSIDSDCVEISTPFLDRHNDCIQIYVTKDGNDYILTDDGYTIADLSDSGFNFSEKRSQILDTILAGFGVDNDNKCLQVRANKDTFSSRLNDLIQASISTHDMFYLSEPYVESLFFEDVKKWMNSEHINYKPKQKMEGKSGYEHEFHFAVHKTGGIETLIQTIQNPQKKTIGNAIWMYEDVVEFLKTKGDGKKIEMYVLFKSDTTASKKAANAFESSGIAPYYWDQKVNLLHNITV